MSVRLGVVMDPIGSIHIQKDSSFAMLLEAQTRGWEIQYMEQDDLFLRDGEAYARMRGLTLHKDLLHWFDFGAESERPLGDLDVILMRKDPPFNLEYIYTTYLLELAERRGALVVNRPRSLRDINEKMFVAWFPQCTPPTLVTVNSLRIRAFLAEHREIIIKPLNNMGGTNVFLVRENDPNISVIIESLTAGNTYPVMVQRFVPDVFQGDKRIILIDGEPIPYALARVPAAGEFRGNLAAGATGQGRPLTERDRWICGQVGPELRSRGILFAGLDVIGDYLTEINVTSPTGIRELDKAYGINIAGQLLDTIAERYLKR